MAGTINFAMTQQFDMDGRPLSGGLLYFFTAGTTTPQNAFQDSALTIAYPNPIVLDASGRVPMFYLADGNIKIRLTTESGVTVIAADNLLVIGPSSGGGGGASVDPTSVMATGDIKGRYGTGPLDGFVRCNGLTIGSVTSGATERANADCQTLFEYLWNTNTVGIFAGVTPSRGATSNADWVANKRCALPDLRGRVIAGMDDMGASAASRLTVTGLGISGVVLGNAGATQTQTLLTGNLPAHSHSFSGSQSSSTSGASGNHTHAFSGATSTAGSHTHGYLQAASTATGTGAGTNFFNANNGAVTDAAGDHSHSFSGTTGLESADHTHGISVTISGTTGLSGSDVPFTKVQPTMVMTIYIKL